MARVRRRFVDSRYGQLHLRIADPDTTLHRPLLCFHLSPGSGRMYAALLEEMGSDRLAIAPDTPGFGESDPPPAPPAIGDYAEVMASLAERLGLSTYDLLGYHTGSKIAVDLARRYPDRVGRLVLVSAPVYTPEELERQRQAMGRPVELREDGSHLLEQWRALWQWRGPGQSIELVQREFAESLRGGPYAWWGHRAAFDYQHQEALPHVTRPMMILCPEDDLYVPTLRARDVVPAARFVELRGRGHGMLDIHTEAIALLLRDFLDG